MSSEDATYTVAISVVGDQAVNATYVFYNGETPLTEEQKDAAFQTFVDYLNAYPDAITDGEGNAAYGWKSWSDDTMFTHTEEE